MLDRESERLLKWYYEQTVFGRSTLGPMLERAKALRQTHLVDTRASRIEGEVVYRRRSVAWPTEPVTNSEGHVIGRRSAVTAQPTDYRGEVSVLATWIEEASRGKRIAQLVVVPCLTDAIEVDELSDTARGTGGFGSTGA